MCCHATLISLFPFLINVIKLCSFATIHKAWVKLNESHVLLKQFCVHLSKGHHFDQSMRSVNTDPHTTAQTLNSRTRPRVQRSSESVHLSLSEVSSEPPVRPPPLPVSRVFAADEQKLQNTPLSWFHNYIHESGFLPTLLNVQRVVLGNQRASFHSCWSLIHSFVAQWKRRGGGGVFPATFQVRIGGSWWQDKPSFFYINYTRVVINQLGKQPSLCVRGTLNQTYNH